MEECFCYSFPSAIIYDIAIKTKFNTSTLTYGKRLLIPFPFIQIRNYFLDVTLTRPTVTSQNQLGFFVPFLYNYYYQLAIPKPYFQPTLEV